MYLRRRLKQPQARWKPIIPVFDNGLEINQNATEACQILHEWKEEVHRSSTRPAPSRLVTGVAVGRHLKAAATAKGDPPPHHFFNDDERRDLLGFKEEG